MTKLLGNRKWARQANGYPGTSPCSFLHARCLLNLNTTDIPDVATNGVQLSHLSTGCAKRDSPPLPKALLSLWHHSLDQFGSSFRYLLLKVPSSKRLRRLEDLLKLMLRAGKIWVLDKAMMRTEADICGTHTTALEKPSAAVNVAEDEEERDPASLHITHRKTGHSRLHLVFCLECWTRHRTQLKGTVIG